MSERSKFFLLKKNILFKFYLLFLFLTIRSFEVKSQLQSQSQTLNEMKQQYETQQQTLQQTLQQSQQIIDQYTKEHTREQQTWKDDKQRIIQEYEEKILQLIQDKDNIYYTLSNTLQEKFTQQLERQHDTLYAQITQEMTQEKLQLQLQHQQTVQQLRTQHEIDVQQIRLQEQQQHQQTLQQKQQEYQNKEQEIKQDILMLEQLHQQHIQELKKQILQEKQTKEELLQQSKELQQLSQRNQQDSTLHVQQYQDKLHEKTLIIDSLTYELQELRQQLFEKQKHEVLLRENCANNITELRVYQAEKQELQDQNTNNYTKMVHYQQLAFEYEQNQQILQNQTKILQEENQMLTLELQRMKHEMNKYQDMLKKSDKLIYGVASSNELSSALQQTKHKQRSSSPNKSIFLSDKDDDSVNNNNYRRCEYCSNYTTISSSQSVKNDENKTMQTSYLTPTNTFHKSMIPSTPNTMPYNHPPPPTSSSSSSSFLGANNLLFSSTIDQLNASLAQLSPANVLSTSLLSNVRPAMNNTTTSYDWKAVSSSSIDNTPMLSTIKQNIQQKMDEKIHSRVLKPSSSPSNQAIKTIVSSQDRIQKQLQREQTTNNNQTTSNNTTKHKETVSFACKKKNAQMISRF